MKFPVISYTSQITYFLGTLFLYKGTYEVNLTATGEEKSHHVSLYVISEIHPLTEAFNFTEQYTMTFDIPEGKCNNVLKCKGSGHLITRMYKEITKPGLLIFQCSFS